MFDIAFQNFPKHYLFLVLLKIVINLWFSDKLINKVSQSTTDAESFEYFKRVIVCILLFVFRMRQLLNFTPPNRPEGTVCFLSEGICSVTETYVRFEIKNALSRK